MSDRQALIEHLRQNAVRTDGPFTLRSGVVSDWYIDARQTSYSGKGAALIGSVLLAAISPRATAIGGMTMGADPLAVATALKAAQTGRRLNSFSVRKASKDHGTGGRLVGPVTTEDRVTVVEDTVTTGASVLEAIDILGGEGIEVVQVMVLVDRSGGAFAKELESRNLPLVAITHPIDLGGE